MKISPKKYAQALYEAVEGKDKEGVKKTLDNLVNLLIENRDVAKADKVIEHFGQIWNDKNQIVEAKATTSAEIDQPTLDIIRDYIKDLSQAENIELKNDVDKEILGGTVIRYEDKLVDASLRTQIKQLTGQLSK
jgi:F-type H+-transporting ATPase subunit delta